MADLEPDPIDRLRLRARAKPVVKLIVIAVVASAVAASMGLGAALFGFSPSESLWFGVLGAFGAIPAVLLFLR